MTHQEDTYRRASLGAVCSVHGCGRFADYVRVHRWHGGTGFYPICRLHLSGPNA